MIWFIKKFLVFLKVYNPLRKFIINFVSKGKPISFFEKILSNSIIDNYFNNINTLKIFSKREDLWLHAISRVNIDSSLMFLEFGVHKGYSIKYFANNIKIANSKFYGFDSFEGLPEFWNENKQKGAFSTGGHQPIIQDSRISFVKGWFQETLEDFIDETKNTNLYSNLIVHYDADLYSSTYYCLCQVDRLKSKYIAIFDEFYGDEPRALYNYQQSHCASVEFIAKTYSSKQVICLIHPNT